MKERRGARGMSDHEATLVSLDLGSQTIKALMAMIEPDGALTIIAGGEFASEGIREGMVSAPEQASAAASAALEALENASDSRILSAYVSVGGPRVRSQMTHARTTVASPDQEISVRDVERVISEARQAAAADPHSEQLHVIPQRYSIDDVVGGVPDPVGMIGYELRVETCVVSAPLAVTQNLVRLLNDVQIAPDDLIAGPLAAGESVRAQSATGLQHAVVNIGAQTTGLVIYAEGAIQLCDCLPIGGDAITRQMAHKLRLSFEVAEKLKRRYATCLPSETPADDLIDMEPILGVDDELPTSGLDLLSGRVLAESAAESAQELADALRIRLQQAQRQGLRPATLTLTGGGAELPGLDSLLAGALRIPVETVRPEGLVGAPPPLTRPAFAVATGLLLLGARQRLRAARHAPAKSAPFVGELRRIFAALGAGAGRAPRR